jgi:site-specific recombinase XerD
MFFDDPEQVLCFLQQCIITDEEFAKLLLACAPSHGDGQLGERATAGNQAILWVLYDTGIRTSELINLLIEDFDRKHGIITIKGQNAKQRRIALGQNCMHHLLYYLDDHRTSETEFVERGNSGKDHLFLSEIGQPMTKSDITLLFTALKKRANITGKCIRPSTFRDTFAIRYLELSRDASSLQKLLGEEDVTIIKGYIQMREASILSVRPKDALDDYVPILSETGVARRRGFRVKEQKEENA